MIPRHLSAVWSKIQKKDGKRKTMMNEEKIRNVFSDKAFVRELFQKETSEEVQALLAKKEIELSMEEILKLREMLAERMEKAQSVDLELNDDDLESVSGGCIDPLSAIVTVICIVNMGLIAAGLVDGGTKGRW